MSNVIVQDTLTKAADGHREFFLIYDNHRQSWSTTRNKNRVIVFASITGLKLLAESIHWHGDWTFKSAAKYFAQLYVLHGFFPESETGKVWRKRKVHF